ncbi:hypothetical protein [Thermoflexibacter ruber]|uniref:Type I restriction enzyme R protein N terminus (HSDR_N) n=1 Tax=Thermoflexibacter ruber TaxID=1003 RepID=A0A1I2JFB0_9BACT|nr:hypothetical protein [Thermoflexibacter ruber]SFF52543.1 hypothetical protein SAMN04488541_104813 [Thermoflexibacter ruber]
MSFSQFKSLADVLKKYLIKYEEADFKVITKYEPPAYWIEDINFTLKEIPYQVSEAAICENLIYPTLKASWKLYSDIFALWSHQPIEYNDELSGIPDYLISKKSALGKIIFEMPYIAVIEAKKDDFTGGWAQCGLEMYAIQQINLNNKITVFGIVSNGEIWEVAQLKAQVFTAYRQRFDINEQNLLFNVLTTILEICKKQFEELATK